MAESGVEGKGLCLCLTCHHGLTSFYILNRLNRLQALFFDARILPSLPRPAETRVWGPQASPQHSPPTLPVSPNCLPNQHYLIF